MMKAFILAAGMGTRLTPHTKNTPKCLLKVGNKELLEYQLDALDFFNIDNIRIVTGHLADKVKNKVGNRAKCIFNPLYNKAGILHSIQVVKDHMYGHEFICLAGDIIFYPEVLEVVLNTKGDIILGVQKKECDDESSKALINKGEIIKMGKKLRPISDGETITEYVHIAKFSGKGGKVFFDIVSDVLKKGNNHAYMMDVLNLVSKNGVKLTPAYVSNFPRTEIDFIEDLERAKKIFS